MRKLFLILVVYLFSTTHAFAQGGSVQNVVFRSNVGAGGVNVALCSPLATTAAAVTSNIATLTMTSNPVTAGFVANTTLTVAGFTGGDTYFNGTFTILSVTATTINYTLTHANAAAGTNGTALQKGNSTTSCAGLTTVYTDSTLGTISTNPIVSDGLGNYTFWAPPGQYYVQFYGATVTTTVNAVSIPCVPSSSANCGALIGSPNTWTALQTGTAGWASNYFTSTSANPALTGTIRLASTDVINWRNNLNSADCIMSKTGAASGTVPTDTWNLGNCAGVIAQSYSSGSVTTAATGVFRLTSAEQICWRNNATNADLCMIKSAGDIFSVPAYGTATNCAAVGTAASPSVASCGSAEAGHFSCATNATGATCQVNTTAVTASSEIFVFESDTATTGTALGVTCNTSTTVNPTTRLLASSVAATSFTINLGTVTTNPACFSYWIVN